MTYKLHFIAPAEKEWRKLGATVREQFKKKLRERLESPRVPADALSGMLTTTRSSCAPRVIGWCIALRTTS